MRSYLLSVVIPDEAEAEFALLKPSAQAAVVSSLTAERHKAVVDGLDPAILVDVSRVAASVKAVPPKKIGG